jgi:probable addiction module antidote protein
MPYSIRIILLKTNSLRSDNGRKSLSTAAKDVISSVHETTGRNTKLMNDYRTLEDVTAEYFAQHPEEIDAFLTEAFTDYAQDGDSAALLSSLRIIARVKGISTMAAEVGMTRQGLQKALSAKGNPRLDNINAIMQAMGYQLLPHPLEKLSA